MTADEIKALLDEGDSFEYPTVTRELADQATDVIRSLAYLVRELTTWRPMETAPKGVQVLVLRKVGPRVMIKKGDDGWWIQPSGSAEVRLVEEECLQGWLPLPPATEVSGNGK